ncbi:DsbA family protein [Dermabacteraceae bacterium P13103]
MTQENRNAPESKKERRLQAREELRKQREAEVANKQRTKVAIIAAVVVLALVIVVGVGYALSKRGGNSVGAVQNPGTVAEGQSYLEFGAKADKPVVDVYLDFLCPYCKLFAEAQSENLQQQAEKGDITLRLHPRMMLDSFSTPAGYSQRSANAAICVYNQDRNKFFAMEKLLFENQPREGGAGLDDARLKELAKQAGADASVDKCIDDRQFVPWISANVEPEALETTRGTPTVKINGTIWEGNLGDAAALNAAIKAAGAPKQ